MLAASIVIKTKQNEKPCPQKLNQYSTPPIREKRKTTFHDQEGMTLASRRLT